MTIDRADMATFFGADFASTVGAITWGVGDFPAIVDRVEVEAPAAGGVSVSRYRTTLLAAAAVVPEAAAIGDQFLVDGTKYKAVDYQFGEPGLVTIVLARVS